MNTIHILKIAVQMPHDLEDIIDPELMEQQVTYYLRPQFEVIDVESQGVIRSGKKTIKLTEGK